MEKFLYGSNVQRIQSFIFETGKLKEIIGASEFVEQICTTKFREKVGEAFNKDQLIVGAAGKITYLFESHESCQEVVFDFHKSIWEEVPGLHLAQAVVKVENGIITEEHLACLEERLDTQKNKISLQHGLGLMVSERSRRTGNPAILEDQENDFLDRKQAIKTKVQKNRRSSLFEKILGANKYPSEVFALEPEQMLKDGENGWVAIIHADGNNLGQTIQKIIKKVSKEPTGSADLQKMIRSFSNKIDEATQKAAREAFEKIVKPVFEKESDNGENANVKLPLRPVLLGGDDLTLIIRGELAVPFMNVFLRQFEHHTKNNFAELVIQYNLPELKDGLTACAGIAYIKPKYPFHYGVKLSESLCGYAKKHAKEHAKELKKSQAPSCLAFHRVQSAFIEGYETIIEHELTKHELTKKEIILTQMPYFLEKEDNHPTISQLLNWVSIIQEEEAPKAPIREWLTELAINAESAEQLMDRIIKLNPHYVSKLSLSNAISNDQKTTHLQDVIALASIGKIEKV